MSNENNMNDNKNMNLKYFQFEPGAILADQDVKSWTAAETGCYFMLMFYLYTNGGRLKLDLRLLARLSQCSRDFKRIWNRIKTKFTEKDGFISNDTVDFAIQKARTDFQKKSLAGQKGGLTTQQRLSSASSNALTKESKEKEREENIITNSKERSISSSSSFRVRELHFNTSLENIIRPRTISDKTCFRNVTAWASKNIAEGRFNDEIFSRILDYAQMAKSAKKPAAAFMAILKKELDYHGP